MLCGGAGIVLQAGQAEIDAGGVEQGQGFMVLQARVPETIRHLVADMGQLGCGEPSGQVG